MKRKKPVKMEKQLNEDGRVVQNNGKRKVDSAEEGEEAGTGKKAKMEDV